MIWVGHLWPKWVGHLWQSKLLFHLEMCSENCWSSGEYPFRSLHDHRFRSLWTPDLWTTTERAGALPTSKYYEYTVAKQDYEYTVAKQNGGGDEWVELFITLTKGMGEPTYGLLLSLIASWRSKLVQCVLHRRFFAGHPLDTRGL